MSREAYLPPTALNQSSQNAFSGSQQQQSSQQQQQSSAGATFADHSSRPVTYLCGDCNAKIPLRRKDPIRCKDCGHRVLYKERTNRMVQFEAR